MQKLKSHWPLLAALLITFVVFVPTTSNHFTNWDEPVFILNNDHIKNLSLRQIGVIFSTDDNHLYMPLTSLYRAVLYQWFGDNATGYHIFNLLLHLLNVLLVYNMIRLLSEKIFVAGLAALIFGIHPMQTEPIAWVIGNVYLLSTMFFLLSVNAYLNYSKREKGKSHLILSMLFYLLGLFTSVYIIALPVVLLALDLYCERKAWGKLLMEKTPYFAFAILFGIIALQVIDVQDYYRIEYTFTEGLLFATQNFNTYLGMFLAPLGLSALYPFPEITDGSLPVIYYISPAITLILIAIPIWLYKQNRLLATVSIFFVASIFFYLKFSFLDPYGRYIMADRYMYIPIIGLAWFVAATVVQLAEKWKARKSQATPIMAAVVGIWLLALAGTSFLRGQVWEDSQTLWTDVIQKYPDARIAYSLRGSYYLSEKKDLRKAISDYRQCIRIAPQHHEAYINIGSVYQVGGVPDSAIYFLNQAINLYPDDVRAYLNRANANYAKQQLQAALEDYNKAIAIKPDYVNAYINRGNTYGILGQADKAIQDLNKAIELDPGNPQPWMSRGVTYQKQGQHQKAIEDLTQMIQLAPKKGESYYFRALSYKSLGLRDKAQQDLTKAQQLGVQVPPEAWN